jgi:hypothetical protein
MVIVKKPSVDVAFAQRSLNGGEIHGQTSIVNNAGEFGRIAGVDGSFWNRGRF